MEEKLGNLEVFKEHLRSFNPIADRVIGRFCQQHRVFSRIDFKFFKDMPPDSLHIVPVLHHAVLHRVAQLENALEFIGLLSNKSVLFIRGKHDSLVFGSANVVIEYD